MQTIYSIKMEEELKRCPNIFSLTFCYCKENDCQIRKELNNMKTTHKISEYINRNAERKNAHWKITGESKMFMHDGMWYDAYDFDKILSLYEYVKFNDKGENQDKTRIK